MKHYRPNIAKICSLNAKDDTIKEYEIYRELNEPTNYNMSENKSAKKKKLSEKEKKELKVRLSLLEEEHKKMRTQLNTVKQCMKDAVKNRDEAKEKYKGINLKLEELKKVCSDTSHLQYHVAVKMLPFAEEAQT